MADPKILSTAEFLSTMKKTPLGSNTDLTFGDAQALATSGINITDYDFKDTDYTVALEEEEQENLSWWDSLVSGFSEFGKSVLTGFVGFFEGIVDFGASVVSNVMDWAGADTTDINNFIAADYSSRIADAIQNFSDVLNVPYIIGDLVQGREIKAFNSEFWEHNFDLTISDSELKEWRSNYTYNKDVLADQAGWFGDAALGVGNAVGQIIPTVILGAVTGGSSLAAQAAMYTTLGISAAGQGTQGGLQEGADIHTASMYGLLSGATEVATEMIGGIGADIETGALGKLLRKTSVGSKFLNSMAGQVVGNFVAEGLEEVMSDAVNPLWKKLTINPDMDLGKEYTSVDFWGELGTSFVIGGIAGGIMGGIKGYKDAKTTINGKKIGIEGARVLREYADTSNSFQEKATKAVRQFSEMVGTDIESIAEGTDIRVVMQDVLNNTEKTFSETEVKKLQRLIDDTANARDAFKAASDTFMEEMNKYGVTEADLIAQYGESKNKQLQKIADRFRVDTNNADLTETGTNFIIEDSGLTIDSTTADELTISTASMVINNEGLIEAANNFTIADSVESRTATEKWERIADSRELDGEAREKFINRNAAAEVVREVVERAELDPTNEATADIVVEVLGETTSIDEAVELARFEGAKLPDTSRRHNIGNREVSSIQKQKFSAVAASLANKFYDDSFAVRQVLKNMGMSNAEINELVRKVRSSAGVANRITTDGFFDIVYEDGKYKIKNKTKGLYNGKDGILDIMKEYAATKGMNFDDVNSLVQEGLSLLDELDRGQVTYDSRSLTREEMDVLKTLHPELHARIEGGEVITASEFESITAEDERRYSSHPAKSVFGEFYSKATLTAEQLATLQEKHPELYDKIMEGDSISEAEFKEETKGDGVNYTGALLTQEQINQRLDQIREQVTNFDEITNWVYEINDQVLEMRRASGMISEKDFNYWKKTKPHYVPEFRVLIGQNAGADSGVKILNSGLHYAKGSNLVIQDIFLSIQSQIEKMHRFNAMNELVMSVYDSYVAAGRNVDGIEEVSTAPWVTDMDQELEALTQAFVNGQTIYGYRNGEQVTMRVNPQIAESLNSLNGTLRQIGENSRILTAVRKVAGTIRSLMTTWNPFFSWFRNPIKDLQGAVIYSKNGAATILKNWGRALTQVVSHSELFQIYEVMSGQTLTLKDSYKGTGEKSFYKELERGKTSKAIRELVKHYSNANEIMEHTTRFAEFLSTFERLTKKGVSYQNAIQTALVDANEVTLNFSRKGIYTRVLNQYVPFLTANIEGAARNIRAFIAPESAKEWAALLIKMLILGLVPQIIQEIIYANDEDYQNLSDTMKSNYYLIKAGDQFIRIPKGFIQQAFGADVVLANKFARGEDVDFDDFKVWFDSEKNAVGVDVSGVFFQPVIDAKNNKTWYGGEIVSQKWDNTRPENQYTDETSEISKFIGKIFKISPLKVQYVLDQMTGIVGDIVLPLTARKSNNVAEIFKGQFVTDPVYKNRLSSEFYDYKQEITFRKTDGDVIGKVVLSYLTKCSNEIQDFKAMQDELESDESISKEEKESQQRLYQSMMNVVYKEAVENAKVLEKELRNYELSEESYDADVREAIRQSLGAEEALRMAGSKVYKKAQTWNRIGLSYDDFYTHYYNMRQMTDKQQVTNYISRLRLGANMKNLLYRLAGYRLDNEKLTLLRNWLKKKGLTEEEIALII